MAVVGLEFQVRSGNAVSETKKLTTATQQLEGAVNNTNNRLRDANGRYIAAGRSAAGAANGIKQFSVATAQATRSVGMLEGALGGLSARLAVGLAFGQAIKSATEFESIISDIGKTSNASQKDLDAVAVALKDLSAPAKTNLAPTVLARGIQDLVAQGLNLSDAVASIEALGKVATATNSELTDVTKTGFQLQSALKIRPDELKATFDALAFAGKAGAFELKDMAQFMPTIASAATSLGITGKQGAISLAAMMQMVRKDAPGAAEASTRLTDALLKMTAPDAAKNFKKFGVDIEKVLKDAVKNGINPMDAAVKELARVTGGDPFKLSQIFGDKEAKLALMSLMKYREEYEKLKASAGGAAAAGTVQGDFEKSLKTFQGQLNSLKAASEVAAISLGAALLPVLTKLITAALPLIELVGDIAQIINALPQPVKDAAAEIIKLQIAFLLLNKAAGLFGGLKGAIVSALTATGSSAVAATGKINMLRLACASLARFALIGIVVEIAVFGLQSLQAAIRDVERANAKFAQQQKFGIAGPNDTREQIIKKQAQATKQLARAEAERNQITRRGQAKQSVAASTVRGIDDKPVPQFSLPPSVPTADKTRLASLNKDIQMFKQTLKLNPSAFRSEKPQPDATNTLGPGVDPQGKTKKKGKSDEEKAAEKAAKEAERLKSSLGDLAIERDLKQQIYGIDNRIFEANLLNDKETAIRLEGQKKLAQISAQISKLEHEKLKPQELQSKKQTLLQDAVIAQRDTQQELILNQVQMARQAEAAIRPIIQEGELLKAKLAGTELEYQKRLLIEKLLRDNPTLQRRDVEATVAKNEALQRQLTQAEQLKQIYSDVGMTIKSGVVDAIQGAIDGTKSLGEVATGILKSIANKVLDVAINFALFGAMSGTGTGGGLLGGLFKPRAVGGPVSAGSSYMVGERGPELFTPKHGGNIVPNNALGGGSTNVVVNVDASGSNVQGDQAQAKQLGVVVSAAVQAELVKQQRPGGLLAGTRR